MKLKYVLPVLLVLLNRVESATILERGYEYVVNWGKSLAPSFMSILDCMGEEEAWSCAREKAGKILDVWDKDVEQERRSWQEEADAEVASTGRSYEELPSKIGTEVENSLNSIAELIHHGMARALSPKKHGSGGIDSITISAGGDKKKMKKKKPPKIHLVHPVMMPLRKVHKEKGRSFPNGRQSWVIGDAGSSISDSIQNDQSVPSGDENVPSGDENVPSGITQIVDQSSDGVLNGSGGVPRGLRAVEGRGVLSDLWKVGEKAIDAVAEHALEAENKENGIEDKSSYTEQRGKKKKKKKAILKLLILGAILKAKIGTLLQILSFKLQVKFFIVALLGLAINLARLLIDLKNKHKDQPQKVIYYEHAQHQHHYDHEEEHDHGWGPWSRSIVPEEQADVEVDVDLHNTPYRAQERVHQFPRKILH